jgi:(p)ppGpp synthase/HD superfamily hydrolase
MNNFNEIDPIIRIKLAKEFASKKFEEVGLKNHFLEVCKILQDEFDVNDQNILVAALLHDTLEDTNTTYEEIKKTFSKEIADLVQEVSHPKNYNNEQKEEYYESLKYVSSGVKMIKLADFTSHLRKFIGAFTGSSDYKKMDNNYYCIKIRSFLESCEDSDVKNLVFNLTNELDSYIENNNKT